jgi:hypothetical protein
VFSENAGAAFPSFTSKIVSNGYHVTDRNTMHHTYAIVHSAKYKSSLSMTGGWEKLSPAQRNVLMEIMDDRHGHTSTLMISKLPTDQWYVGIGDNTLADAILDRLMHNAHQL